MGRTSSVRLFEVDGRERMTVKSERECAGVEGLEILSPPFFTRQDAIQALTRMQADGSV